MARSAPGVLDRGQNDHPEHWELWEGQPVADDLSDSAALLWEQAQRQLSQQNTDLDALRTRAVALLSVAALIAGLFGSRLPHGHAAARTVIAVTVALVLFAASVILAILVAAPKKNWLFTFTLDKLLDRVEAGSALPGGCTLRLAVHAGPNRVGDRV